MAVGAVLTPTALYFLHEIVDVLHLQPPAPELAVSFLQPIFFGVTFLLIEGAGIACLVGAGDTKTGLFVMGGVALLNMPLAYGFFKGVGPLPELGFVGIPVGTAVSHAIGAVAVLVVLSVGRAGLKLRLKLMVPNFDVLVRILRVSLPASFDVLSIGVCQLWFLSLVNDLGNVASTAHGIAIRCEGLGYLSGQAFATAAAALVGQNLGAKRPDRAAHCGWVAFGMGCGVMTAMGVVFYAFAPSMFRVFCPNDNQADVVAAGVPVLRLVAFAMPTLAAIIIFTGALRGAGDTRYPMR